MKRTFHKGTVIDACHLLLDFAKSEDFQSQPVMVVLDELQDLAREKAEGCDWSHDIWLKAGKLTIEDHREQCRCDCDFCQSSFLAETAKVVYDAKGAEKK